MDARAYSSYLSKILRLLEISGCRPRRWLSFLIIIIIQNIAAAM